MAGLEPQHPDDERFGSVEDWRHEMRMRQIQAEHEAKKASTEDLLKRLVHNTAKPVRRSKMTISERARLVAEIGMAEYLKLKF